MHPHHKESHGHKRAHHIMKGHKHGGKVHGDEAEDRALFKHMIAEHDKAEHKHGGKVHGKKAHHRVDKRARGGRVKKPGAVVNVMIGRPHAPEMIGGAAPMPMPAGTGMPPGLPPAGGAPGMSPGMPPVMPRKHGGRIPHTGEAKHATAKMHAKMSNKKNFRSGGRIKSYPDMHAGAATGEGRIEKIKAYGKNARA